MDNNNNSKLRYYLDGGDVCGFIFVVVGGVGAGGGSGGGGECGRVHLVDHSTEILIPRPFQPPPPQTLVDCGVIEVGNLVVQSNLTAQRQNGSCYLPPPPPQPKKMSQIPSKSVATTPAISAQTPPPFV